MASRQAAVPGFPFPAQVDENTTNKIPVAGSVMVDQTTPPNGILGVASTTGIGALAVRAVPTYMIASSRAGLQSVVIADYSSNNTYMVSNVGAEQPPVIQAVSANVTLTGVASTSAVGTPTIELDASITLTGVAATSAAGTPTIEVDKSVTGVASTSAVGTPTIDGDASVTLDGVEATSAVGTPTIDGDVSITLTGVETDSAIGLPIIEIDVTATGVEAASAVGTFSIGIGETITLTGVAATSETGDLSLEINTSPAIIGVAANIDVGILLDGPPIVGVDATVELGDLIVNTAGIAGVVATTHTGTLSVTADNAVLLGVQAAAIVGFLNAVPSGNYTNVAISGVGAAVSLGIIASRIEQSVSLSGDAATASVGELTVATYVTGGLMMTDLTCETILQLPDDFSVTLRWSDTSGYSWSDSAIRSIGATGQYLTNPQWRRLGMSRRGRVWELSWSCPQATALQGATVMFVDASS